MKTRSYGRQTRRPSKTGNRVPSTSARQSEYRQHWAGCAQKFAQLNGQQKAAWGALSARMTGQNGGRVLSARQFYVQTNMGRAAQHWPFWSDPPAVPILPPFLPLPAVQARMTGRTLSLKLVNVDYPCAVQVSGWSLRVPGGPSPDTVRVPVLTLLPRLSVAGVDFGPSYAKKHLRVTGNALGMELWLRLTPVSVDGFRAAPVDVWGVVGEE